MGNCLGAVEDTPNDSQSQVRRARSARAEQRRLTRQPAIGRNQPLKHDVPKWKSNVVLTDGQLSSKRDEFWDTAPAFDGRKEIWDALKAASYACETGDFDLAQAIVNGANITIPHGYLTDCYDELGNRYQLPPYVLSPPTNLHRDSGGEKSDASEDDADGEDIVLKLRLSTNKDLKLTTKNNCTVGKLKSTLAEAEKVSAQQRWFFGGKLLNDRMKIAELNIPKGYMIQVILPMETEFNPEKGTSPTPVSS